MMEEDYLQPSERLWLKEKVPHLEVLFGYEAPPNAYYNDDTREYTGLLVDFLKEIETVSGINFRFRNFKTWNELVEYSKTGQNFIVVGIAHTDDRATYLSFTNPFVKVPYIIITRKNSSIATTKDLIGKKVCTVKNYAVNDYLNYHFPEIKPVGVTDNLEGLRAVSTGYYDAMVLNQMYASYIIDSQGITNLKISGESGYLNRLSAATSIRDPELFSIIDKTVDQITPERRKELYNKWVGGYSGKISKSLVTTIGSIAVLALLLILGLWVWSLSLKKQVTRKTREIKESEKKFRDYIEFSPNGIFVINRNGDFLEINPSIELLTGYPAYELLRMKFTDIISEIDRKNAENHITAVDDSGSGAVNMSLSRKYSGENHCRINTVKISGDRFLSFITDITILKLTEEKLIKSELFLDSVINGIADPIFVKDEEHKWLALNESFCNMFGFERDDVLGKTDYDVFDNKQADLFREQDLNIFSSGQPHFAESTIIISGRTRTVSTIKSLFINPVTGESNIVGTIRDITEQKMVMEELQKMQKLQSVGVLAGGIAHDFNNILMGLFGNLSMAKDDIGKNHTAYELLEEAEQSMSRATRLTKQLLTFAKGGVPIKETVSIGRLAEEVIRFDLSGSKTELVYQQSDNLWNTDADGGQLQQVFSNLAINAVQAMPDGGRLYVTLENIIISKFEMPNINEGNYIKATIRDEGIGISKKHLDRIFDPYFSSKQTGSGLGLATTYSIVNNHGGYIFVTSEPGLGSEFTLYLPASELKNSIEKTNEKKEPLTINKQPKILIMDDEPSVRKIITRMLEKNGWEVVSTVDGKEAVSVYTAAMQTETPFDIVIMDLTIPGGMGGKEAVQLILAEDPDAKVIVSSGYADDTVMGNCKKYGFKGIVPKPYSREKLSRLITELLST